MDLEQQIQEFLNGSPHAVVGASQDRTKYGSKVLRSYIQNGRLVYPVHPNAERIEGIACYPELAKLPESVHGISIITPPPISEVVVKQAIELGIQNIWLQPGAENDDAIDLANAAGLNLIAGGPCILVALRFREE